MFYIDYISKKLREKEVYQKSRKRTSQRYWDKWLSTETLTIFLKVNPKWIKEESLHENIVKKNLAETFQAFEGRKFSKQETKAEFQRTGPMFTRLCPDFPERTACHISSHPCFKAGTCEVSELGLVRCGSQWPVPAQEALAGFWALHPIFCF